MTKYHYALWDSYRGKIKSKKGQSIIGKGVNSHGYDLLNEIVGVKSVTESQILNATGRMPSEKFAKWVEAATICLTWPDPRIWCNRIGALGGSSGASCIASVCSGIQATDSNMYGPLTLKEGLNFIYRAKEEITREKITVEDFVFREVKKYRGKPNIVGYARPIAKGDERVVAMKRVTKQLGFEPGPHMELAKQIEKVLIDNFEESMNINGYCSGFFADLNIGVEEAYRMYCTMVSGGVLACYTDTADRERGTFSPLRVEDINYIGPEKRKVPDKSTGLNAKYLAFLPLLLILHAYPRQLADLL